MKFYKIIKNNLFKKYNITPTQYNKFQISNIMRNGNTHLVSLFKEYLFLNDYSEFITFYFTLYESRKILKVILSIYQKTTYLFPNYTQLHECKYIYNKIYLKQKLIDYLENMEKYEKMNMKNSTKENSNVLDSEIYNNLLVESSNRSNLRKLFGINYDKSRNDSINSLINLTRSIEEANKKKINKIAKHNVDQNGVEDKVQDKKESKKIILYNKMGKLVRKTTQRNAIKNDYRLKFINFHSFIMNNSLMKSNIFKLKTKPLNISKIKTIKTSTNHNISKNLKLISLRMKDQDHSFFKNNLKKSNNNSIISNFTKKNPKLNVTSSKLQKIKNLTLNTDKSIKYKLKFQNLLQTNKTSKYKRINFHKTPISQSKSKSSEYKKIYLSRANLETSKIKTKFTNIFIKKKSRNFHDICSNNKSNNFTISTFIRTNSPNEKIYDRIKNQLRKKKLIKDKQRFSTVNEKKSRQSYILDSTKLIVAKLKAKKNINDSVRLSSFNNKRNKNLGKYLMTNTGSFHQYLKEKYHIVPINIKHLKNIVI